MIEYEHQGVFGSLVDLTRIHGSAAYKVVLPASFSTLVLYCLHLLEAERKSIFVIYHPYAVGALISFFSFLVTFRLNFSYGRYWEGCTAVHQMLSKWLDCGMCVGAFHYQAEQYQDIAPPSFGSTNHLPEERIRGRNRRDFRTRAKNDVRRDSRKRYDAASVAHVKEDKSGKSIYTTGAGDIESQDQDSFMGAIPIPIRFQDQFFSADTDDDSLFSGGDKHEFLRTSRAKSVKTLRSKMPSPSLFMQESAHLLSLLSAVALSTLRNDIDQTASPIVPYFPNSPWPAVDAGHLSTVVKGRYGEANARWQVVYFCLGLSRSKKRRTLYNAARPFGVLGGVSDEEIRLLQRARGPYAKVSLVTLWLQEFLSREYLSGSTGKVNPAILSRLFQFISDGMVGYNQARKIAYIPFPFPNGQITAFFSLAVIFVFPFLFGSFVTQLWFSCLMNFLTVLCFLGIHEVARELENPFRNVPNDLPLLTYQAQFNEALVTLYAGFHPDSWWEVLPDPELALVDELVEVF